MGIIIQKTKSSNFAGATFFYDNGIIKNIGGGFDTQASFEQYINDVANNNWAKDTKSGWGGIAQGTYINGDNSIDADANNPLFQHEHGHYLQSQSMGLAYYSRIAIPSVRSKGDHDFHPVEQDANRRAFLYFNKKVGGFRMSEKGLMQEKWIIEDGILLEILLMLMVLG